MAGFGQRFRNAGYTIPKYMVKVHGRTLFQWSLLSLANFIRSGAHFAFAVRAADNASGFIRSEASSLGIKSMILLELDAPTDGQATTAFMAAQSFDDPSAPILIYNIDTFVHPDSLSVEDVRGDGWIPCFKAEGDHWSFVKTDQHQRAIEVREKARISSDATVGLYWFASFEIFRETYDEYYSKKENIEQGERFVAPLYNLMIQNGKDVYISDIPLDAVVPLGIPSDVDKFRLIKPPVVKDLLA